MYDKNEKTRIQSLLDEQRQIFNAEEKSQNSFEVNAVKYGVIALGVTAIFITLKIIQNGRTRR